MNNNNQAILDKLDAIIVTANEILEMINNDKNNK
jgi:hypothetical protein